MIRIRGGLVEIQSFWLRMIFDLQFRSIVMQLRKRISARRITKLLDVGSGSRPYRKLFGAISYLTVDPHVESDYSHLEEIESHHQFDTILLLETLEHVRLPRQLLASLSKYLSEGGEVWISVPFSARVHDAPQDYWRWTPAGLKELICESGFQLDSIEVRGSDCASLCAKLCFAWFRWLRHPLTALPALVIAPIWLPSLLILGHASLTLGLGYREDPLGYFAVVKPKG